MQFPSFSSLKVRLTLASVLLILASVGLTLYFALREVRRGTEQIVLESQEDDAQRLAATVSRRLVGLQRALRAAAVKFPVDSVGDSARIIEFVDNNPVLMTLFSGIFAASADGRVLALSDEQGTRDPHLSFADRDYFKDTLLANRPLVSRAVVSRVSGEPIVILTHPITGKEGKTVAVMGGSLRLTSTSLLDDLTQASPDRDFASVTIITEASGRIIAHPSKDWLLRSAESEPSVSAAVEAWKARGHPIEPTGYSMRSGAYEVGVAGVPDADWLVFRTARADALLGSIMRGEQWARWVGLGLALLGGGLTLVMTVILLRPLERLQNRALQLLDDDAAVDGGWPEMRGELGELSRVFQHVIRQRQGSRVDSELLLAKMRAIMAKAPVGIAFTRHLRFELVSSQFNRILGYEETGLEGEPPRLIYASDEVYQGLGTRVALVFASSQAFSEEIEFVRRDGSHFWGLLQGAPVSDGDAHAGTIWTLEDITGMRQERDALSWSATHDSLTGLANRYQFELRLSRQIRDRRQHETASLLFIDLDGFKAVNDSASHAAGDQLLRDIAAILIDRVRSQDLVARIGGDEFAVLLDNCSQPTAVGVAEQIRKKVEAHAFQWNEHSLRVGASIGVVEIDSTFIDAAAVIAAADRACYAAKHSGRNTVHSHVGTAVMA